MFRWHRDGLAVSVFGLKENSNSLLETGINSARGIFILLDYISCNCLYLPYLTATKRCTPFESLAVFSPPLPLSPPPLSFFSSELCLGSVAWPSFCTSPSLSPFGANTYENFMKGTALFKLSGTKLSTID